MNKDFHKKPRQRVTRTPAFCKISKPYLKTLIEQSKARSRLDQKSLKVALLVYQWSNCGHRRLGAYWYKGRNKGKTCFSREFRLFLSRKMGIKQRQVHYYLKKLLATGFIIQTDQHTFTGEFEYWLNPTCGFIPRRGEKWFKFTIPDRDTNLFIELEKAMKSDTHSQSWNPAQMLFYVSKSTRRRSKLPKTATVGVQNMHPKKKKAPIPLNTMESQTAEASKKIQKSNPIWLWTPDPAGRWSWSSVPWQKTKRFKTKRGETGIFHRGQRFKPVYPDKHCTFYQPMPAKKYKKRRWEMSEKAKMYQRECSKVADQLYGETAYKQTQALIAESKRRQKELSFESGTFSVSELWQKHKKGGNNG